MSLRLAGSESSSGTIIRNVRSMRVRTRSVHVYAALLGLCVLARGQGAFYLHDDDRVVFYGDSITEQRYYTTLVERMC